MIKHLVLIPTSFEKRIVEPQIDPLIGQVGGTLQLCGFGPVAAAAGTSQLIARHEPAHVWLVGIAGAIGNRLQIGKAASFNEVACFGIGVGTGNAFQTASSLGWHQCDSQDDLSPTGRDRSGDVLALDLVEGVSEIDGECDRLQLLTCCAASDSPQDVEDRQRWFPDAVAEDMEGYGVALACSLAGVPLTVVRGISNVAGDRDKSRWKIDHALDAAAGLASRLIAADCQDG